MANEKTKQAELASIQRFVAACVARGKTLRQESWEELERTGESGYKEGFGAGFFAAANLISDFMGRQS